MIGHCRSLAVEVDANRAGIGTINREADVGIDDRGIFRHGDVGKAPTTDDLLTTGTVPRYTSLCVVP